MSRFEWDEAKAALNLERHGIGFNAAAEALKGIAITRMTMAMAKPVWFQWATGTDGS